MLTLLLCIDLATERRNAIEQQTRKRGSDDEDESGEEEESEEELPPIVERKRLSELEAEEEEEEEKEESKQPGPAAVIGTANPNRDRKQGKMMKTKDIAKLAEDPDLRRQYGSAGRVFVEENFAGEKIWEGQLRLYRQMLEGVVSDK